MEGIPEEEEGVAQAGTAKEEKVLLGCVRTLISCP